LHWGVYSSFAEANAAVPPNKPIGYDNEPAAGLYRWKSDYMDPSEYAVLYWLERALAPGGKVFDFGGHVGVKYYAFRSIGALQGPLRWMVYDVPAVVRAGRELARERDEKNIMFTEDFNDASGANVFLALGSSQYFEEPFYAYIARLSSLPKVVILSKAPMVEGVRYVTIQSIGVAFCPYLIEDSRDLIAGMERIGYRLCNRWENREKACHILNRPDRSVHRYTSLHFALPD
jgi:putative methyltransferase (TIGR04325 family)